MNNFDKAWLWTAGLTVASIPPRLSASEKFLAAHPDLQKAVEEAELNDTDNPFWSYVYETADFSDFPWGPEEVLSILGPLQGLAFLFLLAGSQALGGKPRDNS